MSAGPATGDQGSPSSSQSNPWWVGTERAIAAAISFDEDQGLGVPRRAEMSRRTCQSARAPPGAGTTGFVFWMRRSRFVYDPSFSANAAAGRMTSADRAVAVGNSSETTT